MNLSGLFCPDLANVFVGRETLQCLQAPGEIIGRYEVSEMAAELIVAIVMEALNRCVFDRTVHSLDLATGAESPPSIVCAVRFRLRRSQEALSLCREQFPVACERFQLGAVVCIAGLRRHRKAFVGVL